MPQVPLTPMMPPQMPGLLRTAAGKDVGVVVSSDPRKKPGGLIGLYMCIYIYLIWNLRRLPQLYIEALNDSYL